MPRTELYKYTPGQASAEELDATFVARSAILDQLLRRAREWAGGAGPEHMLVLGPRGMGKTHLLRLLAHRLGHEPACQSVQTALFPEESYTVGSADEFLVAAWRLLGATDGAPPRLPERATGDWVLDEMRRLHATEGFRFLLLVDSFDLLLDQMRVSDEARLHQVLTTEPHVCVIGTATRVPEAVTEHDRPLFHAFRLEPLRPLDAAQSEELIRARAEWASDESLIERWRDLAPRIRAVSELAGGNPRLLLMLYQSLEAAELPSVLQSFRALLDELTPFYKHVVESRSPQQRKLLTLAALHDRGVSPSELAAESGLPDRHVSALLGPLVKDGLLKRVRQPGSRVSAYPLTEPLLRMWLQARASPEGERHVACIVEFFRAWYQGAESEYLGAFSAQLERALALRPGALAGEREDAIAALRHLADAAPTALGAVEAAIRLIDPWMALPGQAEEADGWGLVRVMLASVDRALELDPGDPLGLVFRAIVLRLLRRVPEALRDIDRAVSQSPEPVFLDLLTLRGAALLEAGQPLRALEDLNRALLITSDHPFTLKTLQNVLGVALLDLGRSEEALELFERLLTFDPADFAAQSNRGLALLALGRTTEALLDVQQGIVANPSPSSNMIGFIPRLAAPIVGFVVRHDYGVARELLDLLARALQTIWPDQRTALVENALRGLFATGDVEFCSRVLEVLTPFCESTVTVEPFRQALGYVQSARNPYFLEALNPDMRRAVELIIGEFGVQW